MMLLVLRADNHDPTIMIRLSVRPRKSYLAVVMRWRLVKAYQITADMPRASDPASIPTPLVPHTRRDISVGW